MLEAMIEELCVGGSVTIQIDQGIWVVWTTRGVFSGSTLESAVVRALKGYRDEN